MHISYSMMNVAKQCWKKYDWKYNVGIEPIDQGSALKLGAIIHDAFYIYYTKPELQPGDIALFIEDKFAEELSRVEQSEIEELQIMKAICQGMWSAYPKDLKDFQSILPEHPFSLDFNGMSIEGRLDGLVQKDGKWWVRETKTTSLAQRQFKERVTISDQATLYYWAARKLRFPVEGIMYDALHKPLLRKSQKEDANGFGLRIRLDYQQRPEHYFTREYVYRTELDIKMFEEDLLAFQKDLIQKDKEGGYYRNQNSCMSFNSACPYLKICFTEKPDPLLLQLFFKPRKKQGE